MNPCPIVPTPEKNLKQLIEEREQAILDALSTIGHLTAEELMDVTGIPPSAMYRMVNRLMKRKAIHVFDWKRPEGRGMVTRIFKAGRGMNRPRPEPIHIIDRNRKYRERNKVALSVRRSKNKSRFAGIWSGLMT